MIRQKVSSAPPLPPSSIPGALSCCCGANVELWELTYYTQSTFIPTVSLMSSAYQVPQGSALLASGVPVPVGVFRPGRVVGVRAAVTLAV